LNIQDFKKQVRAVCNDWVTNKLAILQNELNGLKEAGASESKSTMGDKHETAKVMAQLEQENLSKQLGNLNKIQTELSKAEQLNPVETIGAGSLVNANGSWFYIATGLGQIKVDSNTVFVLSMVSPLGIALKGKRVGDSVSVNNRAYSIQELG
jgi:hypothetical protein